MESIKLSPQTIAEINHAFVSTLIDQGLVLMPEKFTAAVLLVFEKRKMLLAKKTVTPYQIAKYNLLDFPVTSDTVRNMIKDGRITAKEVYKDAKGHNQILTSALKRLNKT